MLSSEIKVQQILNTSFLPSFLLSFLLPSLNNTSLLLSSFLPFFVHLEILISRLVNQIWICLIPVKNALGGCVYVVYEYYNLGYECTHVYYHIHRAREYCFVFFSISLKHFLLRQSLWRNLELSICLKFYVSFHKDICNTKLSLVTLFNTQRRCGQPWPTVEEWVMNIVYICKI